MGTRIGCGGDGGEGVKEGGEEEGKKGWEEGGEERMRTPKLGVLEKTEKELSDDNLPKRRDRKHSRGLVQRQ